MYSCLLCSSAVNCIVVLSGFFVACELSCLAPYPFVSQESGVYIARRFPVPLPLQVPESACSSGSWRSCQGVPFRGRTRGGESERGRKGRWLEEGPLPFWCHFWEKSSFKISLKKQWWKKGVHEWLFWALGCQRYPKWVFWSHFWYLFWRLFGLWVDSKNGAPACTRAQSRGLEGVRNHTNSDVFWRPLPESQKKMFWKSFSAVFLLKVV